MEALLGNQGNAQQGSAADGEGDYIYKEEPPKDERSLTEGEMDLDTAVRNREEPDDGTAQGPRTSTQQPSVVDFFLNFLFQKDMTETLLCFQTEWYELEQKGLVVAGRVDPVPDVYVENQRLDGELRNALREREEYRQAYSVAAETLVWVQRDRDLHRMKHKQDLQDMKRLKEEICRLKKQCDIYGKKIKTMNEKYLAVIRQVRRALDSQSDTSFFEGEAGAESRIRLPRVKHSDPDLQVA